MTFCSVITARTSHRPWQRGHSQDIEFEHPLHQIRPGQRASAQRPEAEAGTPDLGAGSCRGRPLFFALRTIANDASPPLGPRRKGSVIPRTMPARGRHEHGELLDELERREDDVRGSVPARLPSQERSFFALSVTVFRETL